MYNNYLEFRQNLRNLKIKKKNCLRKTANFSNIIFNLKYSHRSLTGTPLTGTQRPNWNIFLGR
jgi:hypothetical protein